MGNGINMKIQLTLIYHKKWNKEEEEQSTQITQYAKPNIHDLSERIVLIVQSQ